MIPFPRNRFSYLYRPKLHANENALLTKYKFYEVLNQREDQKATISSLCFFSFFFFSVTPRPHVGPRHNPERANVIRKSEAQ